MRSPEKNASTQPVRFRSGRAHWRLQITASHGSVHQAHAEAHRSRYFAFVHENRVAVTFPASPWTRLLFLPS